MHPSTERQAQAPTKELSHFNDLLRGKSAQELQHLCEEMPRQTMEALAGDDNQLLEATDMHDIRDITLVFNIKSVKDLHTLTTHIEKFLKYVLKLDLERQILSIPFSRKDREYIKQLDPTVDDDIKPPLQIPKFVLTLLAGRLSDVDDMTNLIKALNAEDNSHFKINVPYTLAHRIDEAKAWSRVKGLLLELPHNFHLLKHSNDFTGTLTICGKVPVNWKLSIDHLQSHFGSITGLLFHGSVDAPSVLRDFLAAQCGFQRFSKLKTLGLTDLGVAFLRYGAFKGLTHIFVTIVRNRSLDAKSFPSTLRTLTIIGSHVRSDQISERYVLTLQTDALPGLPQLIDIHFKHLEIKVDRAKERTLLSCLPRSLRHFRCDDAKCATALGLPFRALETLSLHHTHIKIGSPALFIKTIKAFRGSVQMTDHLDPIILRVLILEHPHRDIQDRSAKDYLQSIEDRLGRLYYLFHACRQLEELCIDYASFAPCLSNSHLMHMLSVLRVLRLHGTPTPKPIGFASMTSLQSLVLLKWLDKILLHWLPPSLQTIAIPTHIAKTLHKELPKESRLHIIPIDASSDSHLDAYEDSHQLGPCSVSLPRTETSTHEDRPLHYLAMFQRATSHPKHSRPVLASSHTSHSASKQKTSHTSNEVRDEVGSTSHSGHQSKRIR